MPEGIIFLYSQFVNSGVYSIAIFLELLGVKNYSGRNILRNRNIEPLLDKNGKEIKYLMKTGTNNKDFNDYKDKDEANNVDGSIVKFILGTKWNTSEGISILNVREIHIFDPWYHLNMIEQINGRGIRNCSHKLLDLEREMLLFICMLLLNQKMKEYHIEKLVIYGNIKQQRKRQ